jgi:potassium efflux system protein
MSKTPKNTPPRVSVCLTVAFLVATCLPLFAQGQEASDSELDLSAVRELRQQIEDNDSLEAGLKTQLLELYTQAVSDLEAAAQAEARVQEYQQQRSNIEPRLAALRFEVNRAERRTRLSLPENQSSEQVQSAMTRELSELASHRLSLRDTEVRAEERVRRRSEIANQLGTLDPQIESLTDELSSPAESGLSQQLKEAARTRLLARRQALLGQRDALRAELAWVEDRAVLIPWQRDQAELRVTRSEELVTLLDAALQDLRRDEAVKALEEMRLRYVEVTQPQAFAEMVEEVEQLAGTLWSPEGVIAQSLVTDVALAQTRKDLAGLERILQLTRRRFEAVGHRGDITQWYPENTSDFPGIPETAREILRLETLIPNLQHQLIQYEEERVRFREFENGVSTSLEEIQSSESSSLTPEVESLIWDLVRTRRELLDALISQGGRYSSRIEELVTVLRNFLVRSEELESFTRERLLWVRSVPGSILPNFWDALSALRWILSPANWLPVFGVIGRAAAAFPFRTLGFILLFALLLKYRGRMRARLELLADRVADTENDSFGASLEAVLHTLLLALPLPLALYLTGRVLADSNDSFLMDAGNALRWVAGVGGLFALARQWLRPRGFAEAHLGWPTDVMGPIQEKLIWLKILVLPSLYVALHLGWAGLSPNTSAELQAYNNSLGRMAFILATGGLGIHLCRVFWDRQGGQWLNPRVSQYALPVITVSLLVPAVLAALGFYVTGILLGYQMLRSLWLAAGIILLGGLLHRRVVTTHQRLALQSSSLPAGPDIPDDRGDLGEQPPRLTQEDLADAQDKTHRLVRFVLVVTAGIGFFVIWSVAVPELQILRRIQVWPSIELMESTTQGAGQVSTILASEAGASGTPAEAESGEGTTPALPLTVLPASPAAQVSGSDSSSVLTLWRLLEALFAALLTVVIVRNAPGVLELPGNRLVQRPVAGRRLQLRSCLRAPGNYRQLRLGFDSAIGTTHPRRRRRQDRRVGGHRDSNSDPSHHHPSLESQ